MIPENRLAFFSDVCMAIYIFVLPFPHTSALKSSMFAIAVVLWIADRVRSHQPIFRRTPLDLMIALTAAAALISTILSKKPQYSFQEIRSELLWQIGIYYVLTLSILDPKRLKLLIIALLLSATFISAYGVFGYVTQLHTHVDGIVGARATSIFPSFGRAAFYISMVFPFILAFFLYSARPAYLWILGVMIGINVLFLTLTFARGSWVSLFIVVCIFSLVRDRRILAALLIIILISPLFIPDSVLKRAASMFYVKHFKTVVIMGDRYWLWSAALAMIKDHPFFGLGYGNRLFQMFYPQYISPNASGEILENAHNFYLQIAVEQGIIGALVVMSLFGVVLYSGIRAFIRSRPDEVRALVLGCLGSLTVFFTYGMSVYRYENEIGIMLWFIIAFIMIVKKECDIGRSHVISG